eukprot:Sspe_Gene.84462::Locus_55449_Transcript_1_1_Confidence_1.000_Length_1536::g.84462::m.84462
MFGLRACTAAAQVRWCQCGVGSIAGVLDDPEPFEEDRTLRPLLNETIAQLKKAGQLPKQNVFAGLKEFAPRTPEATDEAVSKTLLRHCSPLLAYRRTEDGHLHSQKMIPVVQTEIQRLRGVKGARWGVKSYTVAIKLLSTVRAANYAMILYEEMKMRGVAPEQETFEHLLAALSRRVSPEELQKVINEMLMQGIPHSPRTRLQLLVCLARAKDEQAILDVLDEMKEGGEETSLHVYSAAISGCVTFSTAMSLLRQAIAAKHTPDDLLLTALLNVLAASPRKDEVLPRSTDLIAMFRREYSVAHSTSLMNATLKCFRVAGRIDLMESCLADGERDGLLLDSYTYAIMVKGYYDVVQAQEDEATRKAEAMVQRAFADRKLSTQLFTTMFELYALTGSLASAVKLTRTVRVARMKWTNIMLHAYAKVYHSVGRTAEALRVEKGDIYPTAHGTEEDLGFEAAAELTLFLEKRQKTQTK